PSRFVAQADPTRTYEYQLGGFGGPCTKSVSFADNLTLHVSQVRPSSSGPQAIELTGSEVNVHLECAAGARPRVGTLYSQRLTITQGINVTPSAPADPTAGSSRTLTPTTSR